jgi:hypothetical protein
MTAETDHTFAVLAHKESPFIEECIGSLQRQTIRSKIVLSTSTPSEFLNQLATRHKIDLMHNKNDGGIGADWTFAYNSADTQFVTLAHQDDIYYPNYTEACLSSTLKAPGSLIAFTDYDELYGSTPRKQTLNTIIKKMQLSGFYPLSQSVRNGFLKRGMLSLGSPIACPSVMFNKEMIGQFAFASELSVSLDWEAWLQLSRRDGAFVYVKRRLMAHRIHAESQTTACIRNDQRRNEDRILFEQLWPRPIAQILADMYAWSYRSNE